MKGLLIKDIQLILQQKFFIVAIIVLSAMIAQTSEEGSAFVCGYITLLFTLQAVSTVSYDEMDNSYLYLFTLPISRKLYVVEKYLFSTCASLCACAISVIVVLVIQADFVLSKELLIIAGSTFLISLVMIGMTLPTNMKYGAEKGRIAIIVFAAMFALILVFFEKGQVYLQIDMNALLENMSSATFGVCAGMTIIVLFFISFLISMRVMEKKQF